MFLYVLKLKTNKWYVGTTARDVSVRFEEHRLGFGSEWTKRYPPIIIDDYRPILPLQNHLAMERKETYRLMIQHGVNNVRGGPKIQVEDFSAAELEGLVTEIGHDLDMKFSDVRAKLGLPLRAVPSVADPRVVSSVAHQPTKRVYASKEASRSGISKRTKIEAFSICARCGNDKPADDEKPLCRTCWRQMNDAFYFCACCDDEKEDDPERPLCRDCYRTWKKAKGGARIEG